MKSVLLTGGAGYIGSHVANFLLDKGIEVTIIDNLTTGNKILVPKKAKLHICDISNEKKVARIIKSNKFDVVLHFAGLIRVDESIKKPKKYDLANYRKGKIFFNTCFKNNLNKIIFSSTASVYGNNGLDKVSENNKIKPLNPYANTKLKLEKFLIKKSKTNKIKFIILRYFNVAGADTKLRTGLISKSSTNLIKVINEVAVGKRKKFIINGNNYKTKDGTPIRDFIHVSDLSEIHYLVGKYLFKVNKSNIFNCGYGKGYSVLQVLNKMNEISQRKIPIIFGKRRSKDIMISISNTKKFQKYFKWKPKYNSLKFILNTSYKWEKKIKSLKI
jgi:UDP-glucose 4-epimerase